MAKVLLKDVAEMAGVSKASASMALNNYPNISAATRKTVVQCARRLGYHPPRRRRAGTAPGRAAETGTIVVITCGSKEFDTNPYYASIVTGAMSAARNEGRRIVISHWLPEEMQRLKPPAELGESTVAGAMITGWCDPSAVDCLLRTGVSVVMVDTNIVHSECDCVGPDNYAAIRTAVEHLRELGHTRIGALFGSFEHVDWRKKRDAFITILGPDASPASVLVSSDGTGADTWDTLCSRVPGVTAVVATWDHGALELLSELHAKGIRCPDDISVIGIDGIAAGEFSGPPLTTVNTDQKGMGQLAALQLIQRITHPKAPFSSIMPRARLIRRASCCPPRDEAKRVAS